MKARHCVWKHFAISVMDLNGSLNTVSLVTRGNKDGSSASEMQPEILRPEA